MPPTPGRSEVACDGNSGPPPRDSHRPGTTARIVSPRADSARDSFRMDPETPMKNIIDIEGVGEVYAKKLTEAGIKTVEQLLERGATPKGRDELAEKTGISSSLLLRWVNHADL